MGVHGFAYAFFRIWKRLSFRSDLGCMQVGAVIKSEASLNQANAKL